MGLHFWIVICLLLFNVGMDNTKWIADGSVRLSWIDIRHSIPKLLSHYGSLIVPELLDYKWIIMRKKYPANGGNQTEFTPPDRGEDIRRRRVGGLGINPRIPQ